MLFLIVLQGICIRARSSRSENTHNVPKFGRQFLSRYSLPELGESVCTVTEEVVSLQQNCVDCLKNVSSVLLTEEGSRMYIGAKSLLLSVDMDKCETTSTLPWMGEASSMNCETQWECGNFITRILDLEGTNLVACGTNYGNPEAIVMKPGLVMLEKITDLPRICSQSPYWSSTYLQSDRSIFVGVNEDSETSAITRFDVSQFLQLSADRAVTTSELWLNKAKFVSSFEHGDFVYFVMREHSDDKFRATIGRVCKSDPGYSDDQSEIERLFLSFTKTHITCKMSVSPRQTLDFSVIITATFNPTTQQLYATFTQYLDVDIGGYAVCGFSLESIDASFDGDYLTFNEAGLEVSEPLGDKINCVDYRTHHDARSLYTTSTIVTQTTPFPIYYELKKFMTVLSETVGQHTMLYVGTNTGTVEKVVIAPDNKLVLTTEFVIAEPHVRVMSMQFANSGNRDLVVSTENSVSKFPVSRCKAHLELDTCITIQDPHCCWCQTSHSCSHINDCDQCVNDPVSGSVPTAFGRLTDYIWEKEGPCVAVCDEYEEACNRGEKIIKFMQVYPKILEMRSERENCTYTGVWKRTGPISDNVTDVENITTKEARFGTLSDDGGLYKILALVFGSLFIVSIFIIVFLMFYKGRSTIKSKNESKKRKSFADRTNSTNIISDKPISYMTSPKKIDNTPMMPINNNMNNSMIMPQDLDKLNNSPYRSHMTQEDERLLQVNIASRDPTENMYSDVHGAQTLPRNFGNNPSVDRRNPNLPNYSMTLQRQNNQNRFNYNNPPQQEYPRFAPNILS